MALTTASEVSKTGNLEGAKLGRGQRVLLKKQQFIILEILT